MPRDPAPNGPNRRGCLILVIISVIILLLLVAIGLGLGGRVDTGKVTNLPIVDDSTK